MNRYSCAGKGRAPHETLFSIFSKTKPRIRKCCSFFSTYFYIQNHFLAFESSVTRYIVFIYTDSQKIFITSLLNFCSCSLILAKEKYFIVFVRNLASLISVLMIHLQYLDMIKHFILSTNERVIRS